MDTMSKTLKIASILALHSVSGLVKMNLGTSSALAIQWSNDSLH